MKLASIETITSISAHPNADSLEIAHILGWQAIVRKGAFTAGDRCVFVVIDTLVPYAPWSSFLFKNGKEGDYERLRTVKLRGQHSQGLVLPTSVLTVGSDWQIGADVGGLLGIKKYEKEIPACLSGEVAGDFPSYLVSRTDEDNGKSLSEDAIRYLFSQFDHFDVTKKMDGSSCTIIYEAAKGISHVCSRNLSLKESEKNAFWQAARDLKLGNLHESTSSWDTFILQGELMGPGIQGNQLGLSKPTLYLYQVRTTKSPWVVYTTLAEIAHRIGCEVVPHVGYISSKTFLGQNPIPYLQELANYQTLPNGRPAEGIVVRPMSAPSAGVGRPLGFKIINQNYGE